MTEKITLPSGAILDITLMPFETAWEVSQMVTKEIEKLAIDPSVMHMFSRDEKTDVNLSEIFNLKGPICSILANPVLVDAAKICFFKCTYNDVRIDKNTFEKVECRSDFIPAIYFVLKENLSPFFGSLLSFFTTK